GGTDRPWGGNDLSVQRGLVPAYSDTGADPRVDTVSSVATSCGGNGTKSNASNTNTSGSFDCSFPDGPAGSSVSAQATDSDGDAGNSASQTVTVNNVAPSVSYTSSPATANEGQTKTYNFSVSDPGNDTYAVSAGKPDCGSGGSLVGGSYSIAGNSGAQTGSFQCSFPDGPAST